MYPTVSTYISQAFTFQILLNKFLLENDSTGLQWKWVSVKPGGHRPAPRSGVNLAVAANGKGYIFGGVLDVVFIVFIFK